MSALAIERMGPDRDLGCGRAVGTCAGCGQGPGYRTWYAANAPQFDGCRCDSQPIRCCAVGLTRNRKMNFLCSNVRRWDSPVVRHTIAATCMALAMGCALPCRADDAPAVKLSEAEQAKADELGKTTLLAKKEADAIAAQAAVAKAKVAA